MTFLAPIAGLVAAAVAAAILLAFYILKLRRRPVRVSSIVLWITSSTDTEVNVPWRRLSLSWLLLLHALIAAFLAAALARPAINLGPDSPRRLVLVLDRSASMSALGPDGLDRLTRAKALAREQIRSLSVSEGSCAVISFAARAAVARSFTDDLALAAAEVDAITPTDQPADLDQALTLAAGLVSGLGAASESARAEPPLVLLISDGNFPAPAGPGIPGATLRFIRVRDGIDSRPLNLGVTSLAARRDQSTPALVRLFAAVASSADHPVRTTVTLSLDGQVLERRALDVPPGTSAPVNFEFTSGKGGLAALTLPGNDALASDDLAAALVEPAGRPSVLLVSRDAPSDVGLTAQGLLADVLTELASPLVRVSRAEFETLAPEIIAGYSLVVFDGATPRSIPPIPSLSFGAGLPTPGLTLASGLNPAGDITDWRRTHPALRDVTLDAVLVAQSHAFASQGRESDSALTDLARLPAGPAIRLAERAGVPHIVVAFDLTQSNWPIQTSFPIFLAAATDFLARRGPDFASLAPTTVDEVQVKPTAASVGLQGPLSFSVDAGKRTLVNLPRFERAGLYRLSGATLGLGAWPVVPVSLLRESETMLAGVDEFTSAGRQVSSRALASVPREVGWWCVLAAAVLSVIEWFVFGRRAT